MFLYLSIFDNNSDDDNDDDDDDDGDKGLAFKCI